MFDGMPPVVIDHDAYAVFLFSERTDNFREVLDPVVVGGEDFRHDLEAVVFRDVSALRVRLSWGAESRAFRRRSPVVLVLRGPVGIQPFQCHAFGGQQFGVVHLLRVGQPVNWP